MNTELQELMNFLSDSHNLTLTSILSVTDQFTWEQHKHIILSTAPFLTLEMAINRVSTNRKRSSVPEPHLIFEAIKYASLKRKQYHESLEKNYAENNSAA